jgi:hypothetical protein
MTGQLDKGGFELRSDAEGFKLGVDWIRAAAGLLGELTTDDIDIERSRLDVGRPLRRQPEAA